MLKQFVASVATVLVAATGVDTAEQPQAGRPIAAQHDEQVQARYNIFVMEGVLERAVEHGADRLRRQVRRVMPDMLLLSGAAEARGFRLDGYGVFFDIEVPVMRRSVAWSLRTIVEENSIVAGAALQQLKAGVERLASDPREKANLLQWIRRIETQLGPSSAQTTNAPVVAPGQRGTLTSMEAAPVASVPAQAAPPAPPARTPEEMALLKDPDGAYEREVVGALIDAMLDHSAPIRVGPEEWLTVAARDNEHRDRLVPGDPYDLLTIVLRVKGSDLAAFRADRLTREEARRRVEVREF